MSQSSDVEELRAALSDQSETMGYLRDAAEEAKSRMAKMFALRDPAKVKEAADAFAALIDDLYAGSYGSVAERRSRVSWQVQNLIVQSAIGDRLEGSLEFKLTDAARQKAAVLDAPTS
jgi:hypothetical protein